MKASELVKEINDIIEKHGEHEVAYDSGFGPLYHGTVYFEDGWTDKKTKEKFAFIIIN